MEKEELMNLDDNELAQLWNDMCDDYSCYDDKVYDMDELDDILSCETPSNILHKVEGNEFSLYHSFFKFDIDNIESTNSILDFVDIDELYDYVNKQ